jgi:hypothetical protein
MNGRSRHAPVRQLAAVSRRLRRRSRLRLGLSDGTRATRSCALFIAGRTTPTFCRLRGPRRGSRPTDRGASDPVPRGTHQQPNSSGEETRQRCSLKTGRELFHVEQPRPLAKRSNL